MKVAFYAPIKPPDHPIASGDRLIARNLLKAMQHIDIEAELASSYIAYSKRPATEILQEKKEGALAEAQSIETALRASPPDIWLTYHPYCKAPDWIGAHVSQALNIPYVTVEACRSGQRGPSGEDVWKTWREEAQNGIRSADLHICFKPSDRRYLEELKISESKIFDLAPFFDASLPETLPDISLPSHWRDDVPRLITTAMMRPGKKVENFRILANALKPLQSLPWNLTIVGGGPAEDKIKDFFADFDPARLNWTGLLTREAVLSHMKSSNLFVWPGWKEPIGMVFLEAQLMGLPVAAMESMGVPLVVAQGKTGLLSDETQPDQDPAPLSEVLSTLISHPTLRGDMADRAPVYAKQNHSLETAAQELLRAFKKVL